MELVPSHLKNTHSFLSKLQEVPIQQRKNMTFCTADVESLYTNIDVPTAIQNIIDFAEEHKDKLTMYGLKLVDIHELLDITLNSSYFRYDSQVYEQLQGLFMGTRPAPVAATVRMYVLERNSIYTDLRLTVVYYGRYYDDLGALVPNQRKANLICSSIEQQDDKGLIKLTLDYPETRDTYTPYLNTEIRVDSDGSINSRMYRKEQKKMLTLNASSHHPEQVKEHTVRNMYSTAENISSNEENTKHSIRMVDELLLNNGYKAKVLETMKKKKKRKTNKDPRRTHNFSTTLKIPHLSDQCTAEIKKAARDCFLPIKVVTTPGKKLGDILTSSKPRDGLKCPNLKCRCCDALTDGKCTTSNLVYKLTCTVDGCDKQYIGETGRPLYKRYDEHYRTANNPECESYKNKTIAKHYKESHPNIKPGFNIDIVEQASSTKNRKIKEARIILKEKPDLNNRNEQAELRQFLV